MSGVQRNRYAVGATLLAGVVLATLTLADNILTNALPIALGSAQPQIPGFWNLTTTALILSTVSDLIGQLVVVFMVYHAGLHRAMNLNSLSMLIASLCSLVSSILVRNGFTWAIAVAAVFKSIGGGSHATTYLAILLIRGNTSGSSRAALIFITGAVVVLCQTIASAVTKPLAGVAPALPYIVSVSCCAAASIATITHHVVGNAASVWQQVDDPTTKPLLFHAAPEQGTTSETPLGPVKTLSKKWHDAPEPTKETLASVGFVFFVTAIAKATRPLFITYIQHRVGVTPELAGSLWQLRTIMSLVIFAVALPLAVILLPRWTIRSPSTITLCTAKVSIFLLAIGAFLIGASLSKPVLVSGLVVNTLGVATDTALLAFTADAVSGELAGFAFMAIASLDSAGTLVGISVMYPLYQFFLHNDTLYGGIPYYICAFLFTIAGMKVLGLGGLSNE